MFKYTLAKVPLILFIIYHFSTGTAAATDFLSISIDEALVRANAEKKYVLLYFTAKWCGPCKWMEVNVFPNDTISRLIDESYVPVKINGDSWRADALSREFDAEGKPTFVVLNEKRELMRHHTGSMNTTRFLKFLEVGKNTVVVLSKISEKHKDGRIKRAFRIDAGVRAGFLNSKVRNGTSSSMGFEGGFFVGFEKKRYILRPGFGITSKVWKLNEKNYKLNYLQFPVDLGITVHRRALFGVPGGFRLIGSPYAALLLNHRNKGFGTTDYGIRYGAGVFIGSTSKLELLITGEMRDFAASILFTL